MIKMNSIFEEVLREANSQELYFREDPDSREAFFFEENGMDMAVGCSLDKNGNHYEFIWQRSKSNENLREHKFTHYLTRIAYADEHRVHDGQKRGNSTINIKTDNGNKGVLCALPLDIFGYYDKDRDIPEEVLLLIRQEKTQDGRIRLISCYPPTDLLYIDLYVDIFIDKQRFGSKRPDDLDKNDIKNNAMRKTERTVLLEHAIERNRSFYKAHFKKGYKIFQNIIV
jgi:hypothetical protein